MSRLDIRTEQPPKPPISQLREVKCGGVFYLAHSYDHRADLWMRINSLVRSSNGEVDYTKIHMLSLKEGVVVAQNHHAEVVQVSAEILVGEPHGVEK